VHANILRALGCAAVVTNGAIRDVPAVRTLPMQMFASGVSPSHAFAHIVEFGGGVDVAGLHVEPNSLLLGDGHGIVAIPDEIAARIPAVVAEMRARERAIVEGCRSGRLSLEQLRSRVEGWD
jgi:regulator of RNase E activity RraA